MHGCGAEGDGVLTWLFILFWATSWLPPTGDGYSVLGGGICTADLHLGNSCSLAARVFGLCSCGFQFLFAWFFLPY
jgi:hypothetical protein